MILLAVSGGIDSMYMLHHAPELFPGTEAVVAHCNFRLRGEESDGDEQFVCESCLGLGIEFISKGFDTASYASDHGISIEMAARELRYTWFSELCRERGFDAVAVAHNAGDNAETLILNLLRGAGSKGMRGMSPDCTLSDPPVRIIRPLLGTTRDEIKEWMEKNGFRWREDRSNSECEVKRNKIRNCVFPVLKEINPSFIQTLEADMKHFSEVDDIAEDYFLEARPRIILPDGAISVPALLEFKHWRYLLFRIVGQCGFSAPTLSKLTELLDRYRNSPSGTVTLSGKSFESPTHLVKAVRKTLIINERNTIQP